jgi:hypothetical protein
MGQPELSTPTGACRASNDSTMTRSPESATCTPSPTQSSPTRAPESGGCAWANNVAMPAVRVADLPASLDGFANRDLPVITAQLRGMPPELVSAGQVTYDLRRLGTHGLIEKIAHTHR